MSYTPNVWQAGDVVTPAKLNHIEEGIANSGTLVVHITNNNGTYLADHTAREIIDAADTGAVISTITVSSNRTNFALLTSIYDYLDDVEDPGVSFTFTAGSQTMTFSCVSADDYPSFEPSQS